MSWIKRILGNWLWGEKKPNPSPYSIEYYPLTKRYYPKYKEYYLNKDYFTGIVELQKPQFFAYASYGETEARADELIQLFKEQQGKKNVISIPR